ncbi:response regulator [Algoriphagus halophytocola]|uniref:Response regulator n=1 Tax=Algoriphagus halophytocola TaxID=2991499 RepID=A0ABY6MML1_9BACT|nr:MULTISPECIES: response regulator [unclassified Algoriphagus]UZD23561.1 response regulator [Algoriphagus sp. TR-M5]WBL44855.1 response regulator [Algoriphagus sp. TR-M9]
MKKINIIIVDDDALCILIAKKLIEKYFPTEILKSIEAISDPKVGLELIEKHLQEDQKEDSNPMVLYVLLDISMPEIDGWMFLEKLSKIDPENIVKVFMHSSSVDIADKNKALQYERVVHYFHKPLNQAKIEVLYEKIRKLN